MMGEIYTEVPDFRTADLPRIMEPAMLHLMLYNARAAIQKTEEEVQWYKAIVDQLVQQSFIMADGIDFITSEAGSFAEYRFLVRGRNGPFYVWVHNPTLNIRYPTGAGHPGCF